MHKILNDVAAITQCPLDTGNCHFQLFHSADWQQAARDGSRSLTPVTAEWLWRGGTP
jgi:hypothetical protein